MAAAQVARMQGVPRGRSSLSMVSTATGRSSTPMATSRPRNSAQLDAADKPVASAAGVSCSIILAEPYVYLNGFDLAAHTPSIQNSTAMIRGKLVLNVTKSAKIKAVTLSFCGRARTEWPEGKA
jgi:arrestin-related trafficking adapter 3/6